jgi:hypothetical protein
MNRNAQPPLVHPDSKFNRSDNVVIRVYDEAGNVIVTHEHAGDFKEW